MGMTLKISKEISQVNICEKDVLSRGKNRSAGPKVGHTRYVGGKRRGQSGVERLKQVKERRSEGVLGGR